ncbi:hypothetical protein [Streptomyces sp. NPDC001833]|uniref:hypothetical protein n=1 Tax=Streptomyces sp. NPDC001833 TaxID=3154658 RepID=UPI00332EB5B1
MTPIDYIVSAALVLLVVPQIRGTRQTLRNALLPVAAVALAAAYYLRSVPAQGNDVRLYLVTVVFGAVLGGACGLGSRLHRGTDEVAVARAGLVAAVLWVVGMTARAGFEFWATHGGAGQVARYSRDHLITGADAWTAAMLFMALAQVLCRLAVIRFRSSAARLDRGAAAVA